MVHRSRARSSSLFLIELIIAIFFFSVASAVCVEFFVKSHLMSRDSGALAHAVNECSGAAEIICTADDLENGLYLLRQQYPEGDYPDLPAEDALVQAEAYADVADVRLYYDDIFAPCSREKAAYVMDIDIRREEQMLEITLEMRDKSGEDDGNASVYRLQTKHHIARRTDGGEG